MARPPTHSTDLDRKIADLDGQLQELNRAIREAERRQSQPAPAPVRSPWTTPDRAPALTPGTLPPSVRPAAPPAPSRPMTSTGERVRPEEVKRRFANYLSSGPMMSDMTRPLRGQRRKQWARVWLLAAAVILMAWVILRMSGCAG